MTKMSDEQIKKTCAYLVRAAELCTCLQKLKLGLNSHYKWHKRRVDSFSRFLYMDSGPNIITSEEFRRHKIEFINTLIT